MATRSKRQADRKQMKLVSISYYGSVSYSDDVKSAPKITATWSNGDYGSYYNKSEVKLDLSPEIATQVFAMIEADTGAQLREFFPADPNDKSEEDHAAERKARAALSQAQVQKE